MSDDQGFWDEPADRAEVVAGRYRLPDPVTGEVGSWTRASNIGAAVADRWALERYSRRMLVRGLAARPDLLDLLRAAVELDNAKCDEVIETAMQVAGTTAEANLGTTIHEVQRRVDLGMEVPDGMERYADGYRAALARAGLTPVAVEVLVCNRPMGAAGRADRLYREADGTLVVGDTKSTDHLDLAQHEIAPQMAAYAHADWADARGFLGVHHGEGERPVWVRLEPQGVRRDYAVAVHVDRESGAVSLYRVDLLLGGYGANLATQVREWRRTRGILLPYVPPLPNTAPAVPTGAVRHLTAVPDVAHPMSADQTGPVDSDVAAVTLPDGVPPDETLTAAARSVDLPVFAENVAGLRSAADLMRPKVSKAEVQEYCQGHGITDLAHTKKVLVEMLAAAGKLASQDAVSTHDLAGRAHPRDPAVLPAGPIGGAEDPSDPRSPAYRRARAAEIAAAPTVGELWRINREVVRRGGDQAWTDDLTEAARVRTTELDAQDGTVAATAQDLAACQTPQHVAELWERVTVGGSVPGRWGPALDQAARVRLEEIRAATPPAPSNPFAKQAPHG